jgi:hypothetical protein
MWCDKELEEKIKLRYYKEVINPNLEDQNYIFVLTSVKKKKNISKIRKNSHELHNETEHWSIPKMFYRNGCWFILKIKGEVVA